MVRVVYLYTMFCVMFLFLQLQLSASLFGHVLKPGLDSGLWTMDCGLWTMDCGLWTVDYGLWTVDCGLWTVDCVVVLSEPGSRS